MSNQADKTVTRRNFLKGVGGTVSALTLGHFVGFAQNPIKIGASLPMTGMFSVMGSSEAKGYKLWEKVVNNEQGGLLGRPVKVLIEDNGSDVDKATSQYERFITVEKVDLLFGTYSSLLGIPTSAIAERYRMIYPSPAMGSKSPYERGFKYLFYFQPSTIDEVPKTQIHMYQEIAETPLGTAGITHMDDFFANAYTSRLPELLREVGITTVYFRKYSPETKDFQPIVGALKDLDPDLWMEAGFFSDTIDLIKQAMSLGYDPDGLTAITAPEKPEFKDVLGNAVNGIGTHAAWYPTVRWSGRYISSPQFIELFKEEYEGEMPDEDVAIAFNLGQGMQYVVEQTGTLDNTVLRDFMVARTEEDPVPTILGPFWWDDRGLPHRDFLYVQWIKGELECVWPPDPKVQTAKPLWPKPQWP